MFRVIGRCSITHIIVLSINNIFLQCSRKEVLKSWNHEYQVSAKERERSQLSYEAKKDLEELDAAKAQEDAIFVGLFQNDN